MACCNEKKYGHEINQSTVQAIEPQIGIQWNFELFSIQDFKADHIKYETNKTNWQQNEKA